jgi:IS4 transposase
MDESLAPAQELAALYHRRWRIEMALDELKVHLNENRSLRSKTPELVRQEFYALLIVHGAVRKLISDAAGTTSQASDELSFTAAFRIVRRRLPGSVSFPPSGV